MKGGGGNLSLAVVAIRVLNEVFRPVLSRWDPILSDYEDRRATDAPGATAVEWERSWARAGQRRAELNTMRSSVCAYIDTLSRIAGASAIADAVLARRLGDVPEDHVPVRYAGSLGSGQRAASAEDGEVARPDEMFQTWRSGLGIDRSLKLIDELFVPPPDEPLWAAARFDASRPRTSGSTTSPTWVTASTDRPGRMAHRPPWHRPARRPLR